MDYDYLLQVITIGDVNCGKSVLIKMYAEGISELYPSRLGVEFSVKTIELNGMVIKQRLFDTCGQERYLGLQRSYYRGAHICALMFDLTRIESFDRACNFWYREIKKNIVNDFYEIILIGTKVDLMDKRQVPQEQIDAFCNQYDLPYKAINVKCKTDVENIFDEASLKVIKKGKITKCERKIIPKQIKAKRTICY